ncbi:MAG: HD domain-containing protein [Clostridia bacterium]|nr:HD domain-containing protein [Clostridia bacterium]
MRDPTRAQDARSFEEWIRPIIESEEFLKMREYRHHIRGNVYDHSLKVAYLCYRHYRKHGSRVNPKELLRGALLHDYFLYNRYDKANRKNGLLHCFTHPKRALENAKRTYPDLTATEEDIIKRHMFPLIPIPPKTRCGWLVCYYDKIAAIKDYCGRANKNYIKGDINNGKLFKKRI